MIVKIFKQKTKHPHADSCVSTSNRNYNARNLQSSTDRSRGPPRAKEVIDLTVLFRYYECKKDKTGFKVCWQVVSAMQSLRVRIRERNKKQLYCTVNFIVRGTHETMYFCPTRSCDYVNECVLFLNNDLRRAVHE